MCKKHKKSNINKKVQLKTVLILKLLSELGNAFIIKYF